MLFTFSDPATKVPEPPGDFRSNYRHLKRLINQALKEGTPSRNSTSSAKTILHALPRSFHEKT